MYPSRWCTAPAALLVMLLVAQPQDTVRLYPVLTPIRSLGAAAPGSASTPGLGPPDGSFPAPATAPRPAHTRYLILRFLPLILLLYSLLLPLLPLQPIWPCHDLCLSSYLLLHIRVLLLLPVALASARAPSAPPPPPCSPSYS